MAGYTRTEMALTKRQREELAKLKDKPGGKLRVVQTWSKEGGTHTYVEDPEDGTRCLHISKAGNVTQLDGVLP